MESRAKQGLLQKREGLVTEPAFPLFLACPPTMHMTLPLSQPLSSSLHLYHHLPSLSLDPCGHLLTVTWLCPPPFQASVRVAARAIRKINPVTSLFCCNPSVAPCSTE